MISTASFTLLMRWTGRSVFRLRLAVRSSRENLKLVDLIDSWMKEILKEYAR